MVLTASDAATVRAVRVREIQEYDVEVVTAGNSREAAKLARLRFLGMTAIEQEANSMGVTARGFEVGEDEFDEDELIQDEHVPKPAI